MICLFVSSNSVIFSIIAFLLFFNIIKEINPDPIFATELPDPLTLKLALNTCTSNQIFNIKKRIFDINSPDTPITR